MVGEAEKPGGADTNGARTSHPIFWVRVGTDASLDGLASNERVIFGGEFDLAAEGQARQALEFVERDSPAVLAVDLRQLTFMDATGLRVLVSASQRAQAENRRLVVLVAEDGRVRRLLRISGVEERIELAEEPPALAASVLGANALADEFADWTTAETWLNSVFTSRKSDREPQMESRTRSTGKPADLAEPTERFTIEFAAELMSERAGELGSDGEAGPEECGKDGKRGDGLGREVRRVSGDRDSQLEKEPDSGPYWVLIRERASDRIRDRVPEIFVITSGCEGPVLPVFSSGEAARALLNSLNLPGMPSEEAGWRSREAGAGELISVLSASGLSAGPCAGVEKVALDPPSEALKQPELLTLLTVDRRYFLKSLLGRVKHPVREA